MNILIYSEDTDGTAMRLQEMIGKVCPGEDLETLSNLAELRGKLRQPTNSDETIAVLILGTGEQLSEVVAISDLLENIRTILVLPDQHMDTIALGHRLRPRFLSYSDSDFKDVTAVLEKMITMGKSRNSCAFFESTETEPEYRQGGRSQ